MMWKFTPDSNTIEEIGTPSDLPTPTSDIVWIPSEVLSFTSCTIPAQQKRMMRQMVPFALEDQVIDSIDDLHFAMSALQDEQVSVVVTSRKNMQEWQSALTDEVIETHQLLPDMYAIPYTEGRVCIWHEGDRCFLRDGLHSGFAGSLNWIAAIAGLESYTNRLDVYSDDTKKLPQEWCSNARPLLAPLDEMMTRFESTDFINLLQGEYALTSPLTEWVQPWRVAALFAILALGMHIGSTIFETRMLDAQANDIKRNTVSLFKTIDPDGEVVDIRKQVSRYLQRLRERETKSQASTWGMLPQLDGVLSKCSSCRVESLTLDADLLQIKLRVEGEFEKQKEALLSIKSLEGDYKVLKEADNYNLVQFEFKSTL